MSPKLFMGLVFFWSTGQFFSLVTEGSFFGDSQQAVVNSVIGFNLIESVADAGILKIPFVLAGFFLSILRMLLWDYSYLQGPLGIVKYLFLYPISAGIVWGLSSIFISGVRGLLGR